MPYEICVPASKGFDGQVRLHVNAEAHAPPTRVVKGQTATMTSLVIRSEPCFSICVLVPALGRSFGLAVMHDRSRSLLQEPCLPNNKEPACDVKCLVYIQAPITIFSYCQLRQVYCYNAFRRILNSNSEDDPTTRYVSHSCNFS